MIYKIIHNARKKDLATNIISMKHLGETTYILEIKIYRDKFRRLFGVSQSRYINTILKRYNMETPKVAIC